MAKSKEELQQLKTEYESLKTKLKELDEDELKQVAGGDSSPFDCQGYYFELDKKFKMDDGVKKVELNDEQLDNVSGGYSIHYTCYYTKFEDVVFKFAIGQRVEVMSNYLFGHVFTQKCYVTEQIRKQENGKWIPWYQVSSDDNDYDGNYFPEYEIEGGFDYID